MNKQTLREDAVDGAVMDGASKETSEKVPISFLIFSKSPYSASKTLCLRRTPRARVGTWR